MKTSTKKLNIALLLMAALTLSTPAFARLSGVVNGRVIDNENQPIELATATLTSVETKQTIAGDMCDQNGYFTIADVTPGDYILSVSMLGYTKAEPIQVNVAAYNSLYLGNSIVLEESDLNLPELIISAKQIQTNNPIALHESEDLNNFTDIKYLSSLNEENRNNLYIKPGLLAIHESNEINNSVDIKYLSSLNDENTNNLYIKPTLLAIHESDEINNSVDIKYLSALNDENTNTFISSNTIKPALIESAEINNSVSIKYLFSLDAGDPNNFYSEGHPIFIDNNMINPALIVNKNVFNN
jgi:hypothetical protein